MRIMAQESRTGKHRTARSHVRFITFQLRHFHLSFRLYTRRAVCYLSFHQKRMPEGSPEQSLYYVAYPHPEEVPMSKCSLTAFITREGEGFVSLCPELDIASQGDTVEEASSNLQEAVELFFECADSAEVSRRLKGEVYISRFEAVYA